MDPWWKLPLDLGAALIGMARAIPSALGSLWRQILRSK